MHMTHKTFPKKLNMTSQKTSTLNSDHSKKSLLTTHTLSTSNLNVTSVGMRIINSRSLEGKYNDTKPKDQVEGTDLFADSNVSDAFRYVLIDMQSNNPQLPDTSPLHIFLPGPQNHQRQIAVSDHQLVPQLQVTPDRLTKSHPLSTNPPLKVKSRMLYFPVDFGDFKVDEFKDTSALSTTGPGAFLRKRRLLVPQSLLNEELPPDFQIMVANLQMEAPTATIKLQINFDDITFKGKFIVLTKFGSAWIGLFFLQCNNTSLYMRQRMLKSPFFSMQLKYEDGTFSNVIEPIPNPV